ncbi:MAG: F0F1 ATP synthase subunit B [Nitrospinaceae bacterium]|nr:F0F1 ATP synthase subunit B [Nitrospinaceae bacterium]|tara:strand:+ start:56 stop:574 length:519 start_codon:yes stop_codon:yes gene_type:complete
MPQFEQIEVFQSLAFWSVVSFALLFLLLKKYAFPPILEALEERENKIRTEISDAEKLRQEAQELKADLEKELKNAHEKANTIVQMAGDESKKIQEKTIQETQAKVRQMQNDAEQEIQIAQNKLLNEIRGYTAALTIAATEKVLKKSLGDEDKKRLIDESIEDVLREMDSKGA